MKIGSLYTVKKFFWLLFPTKEIAPTNGPSHPTATAEPIPMRLQWWSKHYNCEVNYFSPDAIIVFLEEDGEFKKVLTSDGKIGWIFFNEKYHDCFEEVKTEE